jgi:Na+-driven multidrug efflux pump
MSAALVGSIGWVVMVWPGLWANLFSSDPLVLASASQYFLTVGPCYGFFALGLCLYFASQGAGKLGGPILAGTFRLALVASGGVWLSHHNGTADHMFMVIAAGMISYGVLTALTVWKTNWAR